jgi:DNA ligase (NAD+)
MSTQAEFDALMARIAAANIAYHQEDAPVLSDAEYDALRRQAEAMRTAHPALLAEAPALEAVGAKPAAGFRAVTHAVPMLSLNNVFSAEDFADFVASVRRFLKLDETPLRFVAEPKIDGLSVSLTYEARRFVRAS